MRRTIKQSTVTYATAAVTVVLALALGVGVLFLRTTQDRLLTASQRQLELRQLGTDLAAASDLLTNEVRAYAVSTDERHLDAYWDEIEVTQTRDRVVERLTEMGAPDEQLALVEEAKQNSDALVTTETRAMRLVLEATDVPPESMPAAVATFELDARDAALSAEDKLSTAREILFDETYQADKQLIMGPMSEFQQQLDAGAEADRAAAERRANLAANLLMALAVLIPVCIGAVMWVIHALLGRVVKRYYGALQERDPRDLDFRLRPEGTEELNRLGAAFNAQLADGARLVRTISHSAENTTAQANGVSAAAEQVSANVATVATAVEEMNASVQEIAQNATQATKVADSAVATASAANATVSELGESSAEIGKVLEVITSIAEQTNLLALNATIEAARAGEAGKGFAVVAGEVKALAVETAKATDEIRARVTAIQADTGSAVTAIEEISQVIDRISELQSTIGSAVEEQTATTQEIARNVSEAAVGTSEIAENVATLARDSSEGQLVINAGDGPATGTDGPGTPGSGRRSGQAGRPGSQLVGA